MATVLIGLFCTGAAHSTLIFDECQQMRHDIQYPSERWICRGQNRSTMPLLSMGRDDEEWLTAGIVELARRHGCLTGLILPMSSKVNCYGNDTAETVFKTIKHE